MIKQAGKVLSGVFLRGLVVVLPTALTLAFFAWFLPASSSTRASRW